MPAALRKDLWLPFALVTFPSHIQGLNAYRKLREFRRLHETSYNHDIITAKETGEDGVERTKGLMGTKKRGKVLMDQLANSVADLGAVLWQAEKGPLEDRVQAKERSKQHWERVMKQKAAAGKVVPKKSIHSAAEAYGTEGVVIRWADELDASWAESWPEPVKHDVLERHRYTAAFPAYEIKDPSDRESIDVPPEVLEDPKGGEVAASSGAA